MVRARSSAPDHTNLKVKRERGTIKAKHTVRVTGLSPPMHVHSFESTMDNLEGAVKERMFFVKKDGQFSPPPLPDKGHFELTLHKSVKQLQRLLPRIAPLSHQQFVDLYTGPKRVRYQAAHDSLLKDGELSKVDFRTETFVKKEKTDFSSKRDPVPRAINARGDRYQVKIGRYLKPMEHRIYKGIEKLFGHVTVFKGMNALQAGRKMHEKWHMFKNCVAVGIDASRFDEHVSIPALRMEHGVYLNSLRTRQQRKELRGILTPQLRNQGIGYTPDGCMRFSIEGRRMSGDYNTGMGNCLITCLMVHAYGQHLGIKIQLANNGDDCVVFMERTDLAVFSKHLDEWFLKLGFNMVVEPPSYCLEAVEFCQTHPVFVGPAHNDYLMTRNPFSAIAKDTVMQHSWVNQKYFASWVTAVGKGGLALYGGMPVFQPFYEMYVAHGGTEVFKEHAQSWGVRQLGLGLDRSHCQISAETRASFYWAFKVMPYEQAVVEQFYATFTLDTNLVDTQFTFQPMMPIGSVEPGPSPLDRVDKYAVHAY